MEKKQRNSKQRMAIYSALAAVKTHPSAETLYQSIKADNPGLSLGTVYRNLSVLEEDGHVIRVAHVNGQERYDARTEPHVHFVCRKCAGVIDFPIADMAPTDYDEIEKSIGVKVEGHTLNFYGLCASCFKIEE